MKGKSIRFSIASMTGTLMLGAAALPGCSLVGLLPGMAGLLLIWLAATKVAHGSKQQARRYGDIAQASRVEETVRDTPDSIDDLARQIMHAMNVAKHLPHSDANLDVLRSRLRSLADQTNLLVLDTAINTATAKVQTRETHMPGSKSQLVTDPSRLAEQQRRLINQFKV